MVAQRHEKWTVEEYLAAERTGETKHEYFAGEIYAMAGAKENHNLIVSNLIASLNTQLRQRPCKVYPSDMRVKTASGLYTYPDVSVVCDAARFEDDMRDTLLNPNVIIEVLSPSTAVYDRAEKFDHYRTLVSLQEYVLIAQDKRRGERFVRQSSGVWALSDVVEGEGIVELAAIGCQLAINELYSKVTFDIDSPPKNPGSPI